MTDLGLSVDDALAKTKSDLLVTFRYVHGRLQKRLDGLTDTEYLWQPVSECMTIRELSGRWYPDERLPEAVSNPPFTTVAWRLGHISGEVLSGEALWLANRRPDSGEQLEVSPGASDAVEDLDRAFGVWTDQLTAFPDELLLTSLGSDFGLFSEDSWLALILHVLDEFIHHGAEIGVLRDLYAQTADH